jgi:hypothetical protein
LEKEAISDEYNPYPKPTHSYTVEGEDLKHFVQLKDVFKYLDEPENTEDLSQRFYSKAKFMGVPLRVGLSATSPRSFLAVGFPLLSLTQLKPNQLN